MNMDISLSGDAININGKSYDFSNIKGSYIINRQMLKLMYAFLGLFVLVIVESVALNTLFMLFGLPPMADHALILVLVLMAYPYFLMGRTILRKYYFPELVLMVDGKVVLRLVEWPRYRSLVETIRGKLTNIKVTVPMNPLFVGR